LRQIEKRVAPWRVLIDAVDKKSQYEHSGLTVPDKVLATYGEFLEYFRMYEIDTRGKKLAI
jgi:hypothetical protein